MIVLIILLPLFVFASDNTLELAYSNVHSQSDTISFFAKAKSKYILNDKSWINGLVNSTYLKTDNITNHDKYDFAIHYNREINSRFFYNVGLVYEKDYLSSDYHYRLGIGPGFGIVVFKDNIKSLDIIMSFDYSKDDIVNGDYVEHISFKSESNYKYQLNDSTEFIQTLKYRVSLDNHENYTGSSESSLKVRMSKITALVSTYTFNYINLTTNTHRVDTQFSTSLMISF